MDLIDDRGRLLGAVNVVDAFVVLMVVSVLVAGVGFVLSERGGGAAPESGDRTEFATRYVTLDLGEQPSYLATLISAGDVVATKSGGELSLTDVYVGPTGSESTAVVVRAKLRGRVRDATGGEQVRFDGSRLHPGRTLSLSASDYSVQGRITSVNREGERLSTEKIPLFLEATLPASVAETIEVGDTYRLAGRGVATVDTVRTVPTADATRRRAFIGMSVRTISHSPTRFFGTHRVALDGMLPFRTRNYSVTGQVIRLGSVSPPGTPTRATARVAVTNLSAELAGNLRAGMAETSGGTTLARVTDVRVEPATVVRSDGNGGLHAGEHPTKRDVILTVSLRVRETDAGLQFHGRPLHEGARVVLDFGTVRVRGTAVDVGEER